nr:hypothetical protein [Tanacetum cinerariifolium]
MILKSDDVSSKPIKEKVMPIEPLEVIQEGNRLERENRLGNGGDRFDRGHGNRSKGVGSSIGKHNCYGCGSKNYFVDDWSKAKMKKTFLVELGVIVKMVIKWRRTQHVSWRSVHKRFLDAWWLLGIDGECRGSGVEVVEWRKKGESGVLGSWREIRFWCYSSQFKSWEG